MKSLTFTILLSLMIFTSCNPTSGFIQLSDAPSPSTPADDRVYIPVPDIALSIRKLVKNYYGPCMRVRRSSDNAEQDISFSGAELDKISLESFAGTSDLFITTWYDQSGNNQNSVQTNPSLQPKIANAGVLITKNLIPTLLFNLSSLQTTNSFSLNDWTIFVVVSDNSTNTSYERILDHSYTQGFWFGRNATQASFGGGVKETSPPFGRYVSTISSQLSLLVHQRVSDTHSVWSNNNYVTRVSGTVNASSTQMSPIAIGSWVNNSTPGQAATNMNISEILIYFSDQSDKLNTIESSVSSYYSIF